MWCLSVNRCEVPEVLGLSLQRNAPLWPLITGCCYCCCFQHPDRTIPVIIIGLLVFLPGFYHLRIAYYAAKGYRGYSYDDIPDFGDWARRQLLMPRCSIRDCCLTFTLIFWMYVASKAELVLLLSILTVLPIVFTILCCLRTAVLYHPQHKSSTKSLYIQQQQPNTCSDCIE